MKKNYIMYWCKCLNTIKPKLEKWTVDIYYCHKFWNYSFDYSEYSG